MNPAEQRRQRLLARLTASRQAMREAALAPAQRVAGAAGQLPPFLSALLQRVLGAGVAPFVESSLLQAWRRHPARQGLQLAHDLIEAPVRARPWRAIAMALVLGAALYACPPCRRALSVSLIWRFASRSLHRLLGQFPLEAVLRARSSQGQR